MYHALIGQSGHYRAHTHTVTNKKEYILGGSLGGAAGRRSGCRSGEADESHSRSDNQVFGFHNFVSYIFVVLACLFCEYFYRFRRKSLALRRFTNGHNSLNEVSVVAQSRHFALAAEFAR